MSERGLGLGEGVRINVRYAFARHTGCPVCVNVRVKGVRVRGREGQASAIRE